MRQWLIWSLILFLAAATHAVAQDAADEASSPAELTVKEIVQRVRPSLVAISTAGRDARQRGIGAGFIISSDGLIATNLHVIGEGREFTVETSEGKPLKVLAIHASDRFHDLAVIQVDPGDEELPALELGGADEVVQGQPIVVMGSPLGFKHSVVSGVVSGIREIDDKEMIQLAMPIEPGNSGGPVVDMQGRVHGVVNMKSLVEDAVGFAIDAAKLRGLIDKPNPIAISRWVTIGTIKSDQWVTKMGARWRQRGGHIFVSGAGSGFGGRSLCISQRDAPELPYEVTVTVRLDDEGGAAGLIFHSDGDDKNYGFYPTSGKLRLTCFQGPTVYSWKILQDVATEHYRAGDWNHLKVRVEEDKFSCFVNNQLVIESTDRTFTSGRVGLAKFRQTEAEFKHFQVADSVEAVKLSPERATYFSKLIDQLPGLSAVQPQQLDELAEHPTSASELLDREAAALRKRADELLQLSTDVHVRGVAATLGKLVQGKAEFDLSRAALLLAKIDERDLDVDAYVAHIDDMADEISSGLKEDATESDKIDALNRYLFEQNGYHGSRFEYYHRANSYLNRVVDDREGIPVTLSVLYMELGRRLGMKIEGVGMPAHFIVRHLPAEGDPQLIDVYDSGKSLSRDDAAAIVRERANRVLTDEHLTATPPMEILRRMLHNLGGLAERERDTEALLRYVEPMIALFPDEGGLRHDRGILRAMTSRFAAALEDFDWVLENEPVGLDLSNVHQLRARVLRELDE